MIYFLCGFSGCGKSTTLTSLSKDRELADFQFIDLDHYVIKISPYKSIVHLFDTIGEEGFREMELNALKSLVIREKLIVALGGGTISVQTQNFFEKYQNNIFWIDTDFELCWSRICNDSNRPMVRLGKDKMFQLYRQRMQVYQQYRRFESKYFKRILL